MSEPMVILDTDEWTEAVIKGPNPMPCMKISKDIGGLTMVALWMRTDRLEDVRETQQ